jgi:hypothetical protein
VTETKKTAGLALAGCAAAAMAALALSPGTASAATAGPNWSAIVSCESGGNSTAQNPSSSASGLFQFLDSSWAAYGGLKYAPRAKDATPAEQYAVAQNAYARSGLSPWAASRHCWGGKTGGAPLRVSPAPAHPAPQHVATATFADAAAYRVASGDTLSEIASAHGTTWQVLYSANRDRIADPNRIFPGEMLVLPGN